MKNTGYSRELGDMGIHEFVNKKLYGTLWPKLWSEERQGIPYRM
jgi:hypothetical protein